MTRTGDRIPVFTREKINALEPLYENAYDIIGREVIQDIYDYI